MFVVLALCVCAASASFLNLGSVLGGQSNQGNQAKVVKIINVDGGSAASSGWSSSASNVHSHQPDEIIKVIRVNGGSHSHDHSHDHTHDHSHDHAHAAAPAVVKIIKVYFSKFLYNCSKYYEYIAHFSHASCRFVLKNKTF